MMLTWILRKCSAHHHDVLCDAWCSGMLMIVWLAARLAHVMQSSAHSRAPVD